MKPPANQPPTVSASFVGRLTKYGSITPIRVPASQAAAMAASTAIRPAVSRSRSATGRPGIALLDFVAQIFPDLLVESGELRVEPDLDDVARARQRDRIAGLDSAGAGGEHDHLVGERDRFFEIVRDEQHRVARVGPELEQLVLHEIAGL